MNKTEGQMPHMGNFTLGVGAKKTSKDQTDSKAFRLGFQSAKIQQQKRELDQQQGELTQAAMQLLALQASQAQQAQQGAMMQQQAQQAQMMGAMGGGLPPQLPPGM